MKTWTFTLPFLPPSLNVYRGNHWTDQRKTAKVWKDYVAVAWAKSGRPKAQAIRIALLFSFPDRRTRDMDNYLATGSKLVGDAVKGLFIPDDSPQYLTAWSFRFEVGIKAKTTVTIEEAIKAAPNVLETPPDSYSAQAGISRDHIGDVTNMIGHSAPGEVSVAGAEGAAGGRSTVVGSLREKADTGHPAAEPAAFCANPVASRTADCLSTGSAALREKVAAGHAADLPACNFSETCFAPLCPLDPTTLGGVWYPDEEICRSKAHGNLLWVKAQRKIVRANATAKRYFTVAMLKRNCIIRPGIAGLDPDEAEEAQLVKWFAEHPERRELSGEEKATLRARAEQARLKRKFNPGSPTLPKGGPTRFLKPPLA